MFSRLSSRPSHRPSLTRDLRPFRRTLFALAAAAVGICTVARAETTLTIDEAIRLALEKNPQIKVEAFGRSIARADLLTAIGRFDPAITFRRSYQEQSSLAPSNVIVANLIQNDSYALSVEGTTPWGMTYNIGGNADNTRYPQTGYVNNFATFGGIWITQPLLKGFGFGSNLISVRIAKADRGIADWQFRQTAIDIVTDVITAYSDVAYSQQSLRIAQRSRELAAGLVSENEKRFKVGSMSENEVTQARARAASRSEVIFYAEQGLRDATNRLRQLIGETTFQIEPEPLTVDTSAPVEVSVQPAEDLQKALVQRPDYQAARLGLVKRRANDSWARNQLLPQVDFVGSYGYSGLDEDFSTARRMVRNHDNRSYSAGVVVKVPLTFAEGRGRARSARLQLRRGEADLARLEQDIAVSIARFAGQIETTRLRVVANREAYELAKQALDAELKKLRAGTSYTFTVLNLQGELAQVENSLYRSLADQRQAQAFYDRELGRTLAVHNISLDKQQN